MTANDQSEYLSELYQGEVLGEALFNKMLADLDNNRERYVVATMLQLETETKARLRQVVVRRGLDPTEESTQRTAGERVATQLASMNWLEKMQRLQQGVGDNYLPRYKEIAQTAAPEDAEIVGYMIEHETSLLDVVARELDGRVNDSVETVVAQLRYPLPEPLGSRASAIT